MRKIKRIIPDMMLIVSGMIAGRFIFGSLELWKASLIIAWIFICLWFLWDQADDIEQKDKKQSRHEKEQEEKAA